MQTLRTFRTDQTIPSVCETGRFWPTTEPPTGKSIAARSARPQFVIRTRLRTQIVFLLIVICFALNVIGCGSSSTGPTQAEVEAQKQAEVANQRAEDERHRREQEEQRRLEAEKNASRSSWFAAIVSSIVAFGIGVVLGAALGARTRKDYEAQTTAQSAGRNSLESDVADGEPFDD